MNAERRRFRHALRDASGARPRRSRMCCSSSARSCSSPSRRRSPFRFPFSPVPLTLQPLAVLLSASRSARARGAAAAALYLLEGFSGLPVFAQGHGGAIWLAGPTAGYLWSYPFAAFVAGWFSERGWGSTTLRAVAGMLAALAIIYLGGFAWLAMLTGPRAALARHRSRSSSRTS